MENSITKIIIQNDAHSLITFSNKFFTSTNYSIPDYVSEDLIPLPTLKTLPQKNLSLLHIAALADSLESFIFITKNRGVSPLIPSADGYNPLHYACLGNSIEVAEYIIARYPNLPKEDTNTPHQYVYLAVAGNSPDIIELLMKNGAKLNSSKNMRDNATNYAIKSKKINCLKLLLKYNPRSYERNTLGYTPLMLAIVNSQPAAVPLLLENGADPTVRTFDGQTVLSLNCFFLHDVNVTKIICDSLINVDIPEDIRDSAAVHWICNSSSPEIAEIVLKKGINVNRFDKDGKTGPSYLIDKDIPEEDALKILEMLYEHGLDINLRYNERSNTLFGEFLYAIKFVPRIIDWFLSKGANIDLPFIETNTSTVITIRKKIIDMSKRGNPTKEREMKKLIEKYHIV